MKLKQRIKVSCSIRKLSWDREDWKPELRISGKWMVEAGFDYGEVVEVKVKKNKIILRPIFT